jgi:y4mF family transcriptional regulator
MAVKNDQLSDLVRTHRKAAGLSQTELAELAGVGKTLVFDLEKGHEGIQLQNLRKILKVLNIHIQFLPPTGKAE